MIFAQLLFAYLLGSIPFSIIAGKWLRGIDIREHGSGNAGGTNTFRILGWKAGLAVSLLDIAKGYIAATSVATLAPPSVLGAEGTQIACGFAAVIGHIWTVFAGFRGGKGVATAAGMMFGLYLDAMLIAAVIFALTLAASRFVSLASMLAMASVPVSLWLLPQEVSITLFVLSIIVAALIIFTHRENISRLRSGTEPHVGKKN